MRRVSYPRGMETDTNLAEPEKQKALELLERAQTRLREAGDAKAERDLTAARLGRRCRRALQTWIRPRQSG